MSDSPKKYVTLNSGAQIELSLDNPLFKDFERIPATFDEFISDPYYLGKSWKNPWPFWKEQGEKFFPLPLRSPYSSLILLGATGIGKCCLNGTGVLTPTGYVPIETLKVGDLVASNDGKFYPVTGVFPQGKKPCYEIEFGYDIKCVASDEHIWTVSRDYGRTYHEETTKEIIEKGWQYIYKDTGWCQHQVELPRVKPLELLKQDLPIDPYLLGCLIGDGSLNAGSLGFTTADDYIFSELSRLLLAHNLKFIQHGKSIGTCDYSITTNEGKGATRLFKDVIASFGLNVKADKKHIPQQYLFSSIAQRKALLDGLIDTDGTVNQNGVVEFTTVSEQLAKDVKLLCETLGYIVRYKYVPENFYTVPGSSERISALPVHFLTIYTDDVLGRLPRKVNKQLHRRRLRKVHRVHNITYAGEKECTCISIDAPSHLYIIEGGIPTHNTSFAVNMVMAYYLHVVLCLKNPQEYFALEEQKSIVFAFINIVTKAIAYKNAWGMIHKALLKSPFFMEYGIQVGDKYPEWKCVRKPIDLIYGGDENSLIGLDILCCLTGDTEIKTSKGIEKLENLVNKLVKVETFNPITKQLELSQECKVVQTKFATELIEIELENGSVIRCTPEHKLLLKSGIYKRADELTENDELQESNNAI